MSSGTVNPLSKHFRQPAISLVLPSKGNYYPDGSLEMPVTGELPVYPLTSRDEITLRTPDALLNGNSVVEVIQSCLPNIKNAWQIPIVDLDAIFIAIRIASYGHSMPITVQCPACKETNTYEVDLRSTLDNISTPDFNSLHEHDGLKIKFKPQPYLTYNKVSAMRFQDQRILDQLLDANVPEEERLKTLTHQLAEIASLNLNVLAESTEYIQTSDNQIVTDMAFIIEFYQNAESKLIKAIEADFAKINKNTGAKPQHIVCGDCQHEFDTSVEFDYSNFFEVGS